MKPAMTLENCRNAIASIRRRLADIKASGGKPRAVATGDWARLEEKLARELEREEQLKG